MLAEKRNIPFEQAQKFVIEEYDKMGQNDARWYIPDYWFDLFGLSTSIHTILSSIDYAGGLYKDIDVIEELAKSYKIVISTNNPASILKHKLQVLQWDHIILQTFSSISDFNNIVKNRYFYTQVCEKLEVGPEQMLHVGDHPIYDVHEPKAAGINAIRIDRSGESGDIHSLYDLWEILENCS